MHDPGLVHGDQALREGGPDGRDIGGAEGPLGGDLVVQGGSGYVLRGEPGPVRFEVRCHEPGRAAAADPPCRRDLTREA